MFVHLHARSWFSFLNGGSSPESLALRAREVGQTALALTDVNGVYGAVRFQRACHQAGIKAIIGAEFNYREFPLVLLARDQTGYANLCRLLTTFYVDPERLGNPDYLAGYRDGLICLSGGRESYLWFLLRKGKRTAATDWLNHLGKVFAGGFYVELVNNLCPGDLGIVRTAHKLAALTHLPTVATNDVRFAETSAFCRYDLMCCARLGLTIHDPHPERPQNAEAYIKHEAAMRALVPFAEAVTNGVQIADSCQLNLLRSQVTPPSARLPPAYSAKKYLGVLCREGLQERYGPSHDKAGPARSATAVAAPSSEPSPAAAAQLKKELAVINDLKLEEFFLVVREVVHEAKIRSIRCAGRGSAANSIVAYLLGITSVDPLRHNLLFERFLHRGRGTPDIDIDFDSERRDEIIAWMEDRFGHEHTAMTATLITFRLRLALREVVKAFGFPMKLVDAVSKVVPPREPGHVREYAEAINHVLDTPLLGLILNQVEGFQDCPRHLGLHNGGMILSRLPLHNFSPVQVSANGVKVVQFDKDDVESMGLIKLDVLGLRMLATLSEATELIHRHLGMTTDLDAVPLDDEKVFRYIRTGQTVALFQIESQGQIHLIASHQPETFDDLISEIALFRPGPLQGGMVHPFIRRRRGEEKVAYDHPDLEPILRDTYGVILFQEQILEISHRFAGMSLQDAEDFRAMMSKNRESGALETLRQRFFAGALARGCLRK